VTEPEGKKITLEWGDEDTGGFSQQEFRAESYDVTSGALVMRRVQGGQGWIWEEVGIPLTGLRRWYVGEGVASLQQLPAAAGNPEEIFGAQVRSARLARGWSQEALAERLAAVGIQVGGQSGVARIERAERPTRLNEVVAISSFLTIDRANGGGTDA
jgi:hypothetical protein